MSECLHIALMQPEIGPNAGNIGRLCLGVEAHLHLVHPLGFRTDDKPVRRAGLDYWKHVTVTEYEDSEAFWAWADGRRIHLFSTKSHTPYSRIEWQRGDVLIFGPESKGLSAEVRAKFPSYQIPMTGPIRSLNLANAVAVVTYAALRNIKPEVF